MKNGRLAALGALAVALASLAGCGLPVDTSPQAIPSSEMPLALIATNTTQAPNPIVHGEVQVPIYLISPDGTQLVVRDAYVHPPITPQNVLDALQQGPTAEDYDAGIQSAIPPTADLVSGGVSDGLMTVDLDSSYQSLLPNQQADYFAQIVATLTCLPTVTKGVNFYYNNSAVEPVVGNGSIANAYIVNRNDYEQLAPPRCFS
ncbi:MAG: GerMN domain-containing protein [Acidimicrobiales bacterium]|jgi:spore germination protein GerM